MNTRFAQDETSQSAASWDHLVCLLRCGFSHRINFFFSTDSSVLKVGPIENPAHHTWVNPPLWTFEDVRVQFSVAKYRD